MEKRTALVICPGRGTYNKDELGYLARHHDERRELIAAIDGYRAGRDQPTVSALDSRERYSVAEHSRGDNASPLIYACSTADFLAIDRERFEVVAVTGNSMGWYSTLACTGVSDPMGALEIVNTMGGLMHEALIGGQLIYPLVDEDWRPIPGRKALMQRLINEGRGGLFPSIHLGGHFVFGGTAPMLAALEAGLPPEQGRYPLRLANHAAFHTPLQAPIAEKARDLLGPNLFTQPKIPAIDGRGKIWTRHSTDPTALRDYTLGHQVVAPYDFTRAVQVGVKEFAPDCVIVLGPGNTLGGAVAQSLIGIEWQGLTSKAAFQERQASDPFVLSMGLEDQRGIVIG